ncbi:hypothetical protein [Dokdonella ginsengisoli]|uniref:Uncharacterized protein n=1 Tax=Dokdonella ginsengisoli TaxID=363846 RepID=A0ABV9QWS0_9GAMM
MLPSIALQSGCESPVPQPARQAPTRARNPSNEFPVRTVAVNRCPASTVGRSACANFQQKNHAIRSKNTNTTPSFTDRPNDALKIPPDRRWTFHPVRPMHFPAFKRTSQPFSRKKIRVKITTSGD